MGLSVRNLRFHYPASERAVIDDLSFTVSGGGRVAIVGPSGAGKSSLVSLLLRFWEYEEGSIHVGSRDLKSLPLDEVRRLFSVAEQTPFFFHSTISENLRIASPTAGVDSLREMLDTVQLGDLMNSRSEGLEALVGEGGLKLSAGQARRLSIARALLKPSPFLILDEPTEGLDDRTAIAILEKIDRQAAGRTLIVITHRRRDVEIAGSLVHMSINR